MNIDFGKFTGGKKYSHLFLTSTCHFTYNLSAHANATIYRYNYIELYNFAFGSAIYW